MFSLIKHDANCLKFGRLVSIIAFSVRYLVLKVNITGARKYLCFKIVPYRVMLN